MTSISFRDRSSAQRRVEGCLFRECSPRSPAMKSSPSRRCGRIRLPAWRMFLGQIGALALHHGETTTLPQDEPAWRNLLRALTPEFRDDEPWRLVVDDWTKPGFLQPPVPKDVPLANDVETPDALDLLITARNHDLKQAIARQADPDDWIFALVSLQTSEGFGGATNYGIARMNGGSSSRAMMALAPAPGGKGVTPRLGACFRRDVLTLLESRERELAANDHLGFPAEGGLALVWLAPWRGGRADPLSELDIWFVEVCRRVRLREKGGNDLRGERNLEGGAHRRARR